jgi:hypothetical protein
MKFFFILYTFLFFDEIVVVVVVGGGDVFFLNIIILFINEKIEMNQDMDNINVFLSLNNNIIFQFKICDVIVMKYFVI